ncbi:MAG: hypothetical protein HC884_19325 [Chloroflexaceae bacterium]|nr:hypothetical protein [Chloroflexaceae bacterium]
MAGADGFSFHISHILTNTLSIPHPGAGCRGIPIHRGGEYSPSPHKRPEPPCPRRVAELLEGDEFNLAHALAGHAHLHPHRLQRVRLAPVQPEAPRHDKPFAVGQLRQRRPQFLAQHRTLEEVGAEVGITRECVHQIEVVALRKLRHPSIGRGLRAFLSE